MSAGQLNLEIEQGGIFRQVLRWKDSAGVLKDLSGYVFRMQMRLGTKGRLVKELCNYTGWRSYTPMAIEHWALGAGREGLSKTEASLYMNADQTANLDFYRAMYDLEAVPYDATPVNLTEMQIDVDNGQHNGVLTVMDGQGVPVPDAFDGWDEDDLLLITDGPNGDDADDSNYGFYLVRSVSEDKSAVTMRSTIRGADCQGAGSVAYISLKTRLTQRLLWGGVKIRQEVTIMPINVVYTELTKAGTLNLSVGRSTYYIHGADFDDCELKWINGANLEDAMEITLLRVPSSGTISVSDNKSGTYPINIASEFSFDSDESELVVHWYASKRRWEEDSRV